MVADIEKNDRVGVCEPRELSGRDKAQHGDDGGSRAPNSFRESRAHALLQSTAKDGGSGLATWPGFSSVCNEI